MWPDQADRFARLVAAIELARQAPPDVRKGDAPITFGTNDPVLRELEGVGVVALGETFEGFAAFLEAVLGGGVDDGGVEIGHAQARVRRVAKIVDGADTKRRTHAQAPRAE